jgi:hypothetical protein
MKRDGDGGFFSFPRVSSSLSKSSLFFSLPREANQNPNLANSPKLRKKMNLYKRGV